MSDAAKKTTLAVDLPDPPEITDSVRSGLLAKSKEWRDDFAQKAAEMEVITADDLRARAR